jgi:hypothetical protein
VDKSGFLAMLRDDGQRIAKFIADSHKHLLFKRDLSTDCEQFSGKLSGSS